jgi:hypothetical protein
MCSIATLLGIAYVSYLKKTDVPDNQLYRWQFLGGKCCEFLYRSNI